MNRISDFIRTVIAKTGVTYDLCSTEIMLPEDIARQVMAFSAKIPDEDLHNDGDNTKGRENEIHITVLFGIKKNDPEAVARILSGMKPFEIRLGLMTGFMDSPKYDVLKIDAEAPGLYEAHWKMRDNLDCDITHQTYNPHCTVAYMQKGRLLKYLGNDMFRGRTFMADTILFGNKTLIKLG